MLKCYPSAEVRLAVLGVMEALDSVANGEGADGGGSGRVEKSEADLAVD